MGYYVLDDKHNVIPWPDQKMLHWAGIMEQAHRDRSWVVKQDDIGDCWLSTVFLGLDHNWVYRAHRTGSPHVFETMAFGPADEDGDRHAEDYYCQRYSTWQDALEGHELVAQWMRTGIKTAMKEES